MKDCCNDQCNQGRDCPAKVAPVKCSYPRDDEYQTMWAEDMQLVARFALAVVLLIVFGFIGILAFVVN
jgi:hypothetical protein